MNENSLRKGDTVSRLDAKTVGVKERIKEPVASDDFDIDGFVATSWVERCEDGNTKNGIIIDFLVCIWDSDA